MGLSAIEQDQHYMMRAIGLAQRAAGYTSPNPMVGCVLVKDGRIVGEGFHAKAGTPHAEAAALRHAGADAQGATAYVTLEPCNHFGKNPPCTDGLIKAKVARVVYAINDPNPIASGGAQKLQAAGINVQHGVCAADAAYLIRFWLKHVSEKRPFVIAKFASSLDGKIATATGQSQWITNDTARLRGHDLRQACDAIIVGVDTLIADNPTLTARPSLPAGKREAAHPLRVILDSTGRTPSDAKILRSTTAGKTLIATTAQMTGLKERSFKNKGVDVLRLPSTQNGKVDLTALLTALGEREILSCLIEGGSKALGSFFMHNLVDEVWAFLAPMIIGGDGANAISPAGVTQLADAFRLNQTHVELLEDNILMRGTLTKTASEALCSQAS